MSISASNVAETLTDLDDHLAMKDAVTAAADMQSIENTLLDDDLLSEDAVRDMELRATYLESIVDCRREQLSALEIPHLLSHHMPETVEPVADKEDQNLRERLYALKDIE